MTFWTLIRRSLRFHARAHLGVVLGSMVGSAALIGALVVGDSVRESLHELALQRLDGIEYALPASDRFFRDTLRIEIERALNSSPGPSRIVMPQSVRPGFHRYTETSITAALRLAGMAARQDGSARANQVQVLSLGPGLDHFGQLPGVTNLAADAVILNTALAEQLKARPGDEIVLRIVKPTALSRDAPIVPQSDSAVALRLQAHSIVSPESLGNFSLAASQVAPFNAFVRADILQNAVGLRGRANLLLAGPLLEAAPPRPAMVEKFRAFWDGLFPKRRRFPDRTPPADAVPTPEALTVFSAALHFCWQLADAELELRDLPEVNTLELRSPRIFLDRPVVAAASAAASNAVGLLTYLVNQLRLGERTTPYSMVTAAGPPYTPAELRDDEVVINQWLAEDLQARPGDEIDLTYFLPDSASRLAETTNRFRVRAIAPMTGIYADRSLMPEFPGLAKAESTHNWDAGFPLVHQIRAQDEKYWKERRGTPKAFVTLRAGQMMWANRFGDLTAIRFPISPDANPVDLGAKLEEKILASLKPEDIGLRFQPVREQALAAVNQSQDFGGLFLGFSFFLILAALILMALLFQFGLEQRATEVGTFLALGFTPRQVRRLLLCEGVALAFVGGLLGVFGGIAYARAMLHGLTTLWHDAVGTSALRFHVTPQTLVIGAAASVVVSAVTIAIVLRKQARRPARELLAEGADAESQVSAANPARRSRGGQIAVIAGMTALAITGWAWRQGETATAEAFFGAGSLFLIAGLGAVAALLAILGRSAAAQRLSVAAMGLRGCARRRKRSLATVALLACGSFMVIAVGANKLDANLHAEKRSSGTGGFALIGETSLPVLRDLNTAAGRAFFGLDAAALKDVSFVPMRVRDGDDASCLNLNRAQTPRLLGVKPELLDGRGAFSFAQTAKGLDAKSGWRLLRSHLEPRTSNLEPEEIPAIGDAASIQWALGRKLGDAIDFTDGRGQPFKVRLVAGLANSVLQGNLLIDEEQFLKKFPGESGYRMFLIDAPSNSVSLVSATLARGLQDVGLELTPAARRLAAFNAVQNTYLNTFQVLGALGLLLGSVGLGVVVLRNVLERRGELALLQAVGFRRRSLQWLVLSEHGALLGLGLAVGLVAALVAILPALRAPGSDLPVRSLLLTLAAVFASGLVWTWLATWPALRGNLLAALRNE